ESLKAYIIAKNNLEVRKWLEIQKKREGALDEMGIRPNKDVWVNVPAGEEIPWLVEQIEPDTQYLLVGEEHGFREIQNAVGDLLVSLRRQMPEREIILFTEFWPEGLSTLEDDFYDENFVLTPAYIKQVRRGSQYTKLISSREELKELPIVGLEPSFVAEPGSSGRFVEKYNMSIEKFEKTGLWATLEGVRLRNRAWLQTIRTYRQKYPNALFVVYAGSGHLSYDMPYSLGIALSEKGKTFVTEFAYSAGDRFLDLCPVVHCKNEDMARLVGYDVRIRMRDE
ncbi:MAG: hypothetical protein IKO35_02300, partial [Elusimicrobiaceae bacterium]|nr:hypothetical protein [Elusimicrobiaceae bacterium]